MRRISAWPGAHHLALVEGRELGEIVAFAEHQLGQARHRRGADALPPDLGAVAQHVGGAALEGIEFLVPLGEAAAEAFGDHGLQQVFLALEIKEERALGHAGTRRHLFRTGRREALLDEQLERGLDQFAGARFLAALALGAARAEKCVAEEAGHEINDSRVSNVVRPIRHVKPRQ
jgi:hypothetical protein